MTKIDLPYLTWKLDRKGRRRWYVRRKGQALIRVPGQPGAVEFIRAYEAAIAGIGRSQRAPEPRKPGSKTWRWLCDLYFASPEFGELAKATRDQRYNVLATTWAEPVAPGSEARMGDVPVEHFTSKAVRVLRDRKKAHPEAANHRIKAISAVFRWAIEAEHIEANPARDVAGLRPKNPDGHHTWTVAEVRRYEDVHKIGTKARLALAILLYTGVRRSDAVHVGRPMVAEGSLTWTEHKGRDRRPKERVIPILPELQAVLAATTLTGRETWLVTQYGRAFTSAGFGNWFRDRCDEAGLRHCSAHGLRKAGATIAAENGATEHELRAIFGWETLKQVERYTRKADQRKLAAQEAVRRSG